MKNSCTATADKRQSSSLVSQILTAAKSLQETDPAQPQGSDAEEGVGPSSLDPENTEGDGSQECCPMNSKPGSGLLHGVMNEMDAVDSPGTVSRKKLGFTGNSAFAAVKSRKSLNVGTNGDNMVNAETVTCTKNDADVNVEDVKATETADKSSSNYKINDTKAEELKKEADVPEADRLPEQVVRVSKSFSEITRVAYLIEKALRSSLKDVTFEK